MTSSASSPPSSSSPPLLVQPFDSTRATKGLRALFNISAGTQIHEEPMNFAFEYGPGRRFHAGVDPVVFLSSLSPEEQLALVAIPPVPGNQDLISSRFHQCLPSSNGNNFDFIHLPLIGRANHSCVPNAAWYQNYTGTFILHACLPIAKGEEVFISYLSPYPLTFAERTHQLHTLRLTCNCLVCSLPPSERYASDERVLRATSWIENRRQRDHWSRFTSTDEVVKYLIEIAELCLDGIEDARDLALVAARVCFLYDDLRSGSAWAQLEIVLGKLQGLRRTDCNVPASSTGGRVLISPPPSFKMYINFLKTPPAGFPIPTTLATRRHEHLLLEQQQQQNQQHLIAPIPLHRNLSSTSSSYASSASSSACSSVPADPSRVSPSENESGDVDATRNEGGSEEIKTLKSNQRKRAKVKAAKARKLADELWEAGSERGK